MKILSGSIQKALVLFVLAVTISSRGYAYPDQTETVNLNIQPFYLGAGETKSVSLGSDWRHIQKIFVQASGWNAQSSTFQVIANGDVKGTVFVPGRDPSYIVTIGETTNSIQLQHVSGGYAHIQSIMVVRSWRPVTTVHPTLTGPFNPVLFPDYSLRERNEASLIARQAIQIVDALQPYANYQEFGLYLLPIKKAAARAYAAAQARGALSNIVHEHLKALKAQIEYACPYVDETFERTAAFELAIHLKSLGERLDALLR